MYFCQVPKFCSLVYEVNFWSCCVGWRAGYDGGPNFNPPHSWDPKTLRPIFDHLWNEISSCFSSVAPVHQLWESMQNQIQKSCTSQDAAEIPMQSIGLCKNFPTKAEGNVQIPQCYDSFTFWRKHIFIPKSRMLQISPILLCCYTKKGVAKVWWNLRGSIKF